MYSAIKRSNTKKNQPLNDYLSMDTLTSAINPSPEETFIDKETIARMKQQLSTLLSPLEQQVLQLYLKEMNYIQIAKVLRKKPKTVDNALQRIKRKLEIYCKIMD